MNKIICLINQKGGVGKTTSALSIASLTSQLAGKKVLLIDLDPQGNSSSGSGLERSAYKNNNIYHALMGTKQASDCIHDTYIPNFKIIPADIDLAGAEIELTQAFSREHKLKNVITQIIDQFDYIIIDSSPSLGLLTINALSAAQDCIIPLQCEFYAVEGFSNLKNTIEKVREQVNPNLTIKGVLLTMVDRRKNIHKQVEIMLREMFDKLVFTTIIPSNVKLTECSSQGKSILDHAPDSSGCLAYVSLIKEIFPEYSKTVDEEYYKRIGKSNLSEGSKDE